MIRHLQWLRHAARISVLVGMVTVAGLAGYRLANPPAVSAGDSLERIRGDSWSAEIGPVSLTDPLAGAESLAAGKTLVSALLIGLLIPVAATVLLGRVFCSWVCPVGFLLELVDVVSARIRSTVSFWKRQRDIDFWRGNKYALLAVGLLLSGFVGAPLLGFFYPPAVFARELHQWTAEIVANAATPFSVASRFPTWGVLLLIGIAVAEAALSRRMWCRYLCPGGALYSLLGARRLVRLTEADERCDHCGLCVSECGMGLNPMGGVTGVECDNCLACMSICPPDALHIESRRRRPAAAATQTVSLETT